MIKNQSVFRGLSGLKMAFSNPPFCAPTLCHPLTICSLPLRAPQALRLQIKNDCDCNRLVRSLRLGGVSRKGHYGCARCLLERTLQRE